MKVLISRVSGLVSGWEGGKKQIRTSLMEDPLVSSLYGPWTDRPRGGCGRTAEIPANKNADNATRRRPKASQRPGNEVGPNSYRKGA